MTNRSNTPPFENVGPDWSRPRALTSVFAALGIPVPGRLTAKAINRLKAAVDEAGLQLATAGGEPLDDLRGVTISSKVRLRRPSAVGPAPSVLETIRVEGFKSFASATLPLAPLTVLIGANASGKSNALEALQLLSWLASGQRLSRYGFDQKDRKLGLRGLSRELVRSGKDELSFKLGCTISTPEGSPRLEIELAIDRDGFRVAHEELDLPNAGSDFPLYRVCGPAADGRREIQVEYNNFSKGGKKPRITCVDESPVFTQLVSPARFGATHAKAQEVIPRVTGEVGAALSRVLFLDPDPRSMRGYAHTSETKLGGDGANVSAVLYRLTEQENAKSQVLDFIQALPEQDIVDVTYVKTPRGEVMVQLVESFGGQRQSTDAALLSDGTLRVLAVAAALLSVPSGTLVVIEEIDNGVHPNRAEGLMRSIHTIAGARGVRVLVTTHNPALLDAVPLSALPHVVACYRDPEDGGSRLKRLDQLSAYPELIARDRLGQLVTRGTLDRSLKKPTTEGDRRTRGLAWIQARLR
ncbi:MAG: AAA family ATPase, partial [Myxococcales bacterium]|nr:AAA family ATPase [Myxococcales bacterium]